MDVLDQGEIPARKHLIDMGQQNIDYFNDAAVEGFGLEYDLVRVRKKNVLAFEKLNPVITLGKLRVKGYTREVGVEPRCVVFDKGHYPVEIQLKLMHIHISLASLQGLGIC